eukprot:SAG31_NODE_31866_length_363_cov_0.625000_1_plen_71_part_10
MTLLPQQIIIFIQHLGILARESSSNGDRRRPGVRSTSLCHKSYQKCPNLDRWPLQDLECGPYKSGVSHHPY